MNTRQINQLIKQKNIDLYVRSQQGKYKTRLKKIEIEKRHSQYFIFCVYDGIYLDNMSELRIFGCSKDGLLSVVSAEIRQKNYIDLTQYK